MPRIRGSDGRGIKDNAGKKISHPTAPPSVTVATVITVVLSNNSGNVGASESVTLTPNGTWPSGRNLAITQSISVFTVGPLVQPTGGTSSPVVVSLTVASAGGPSAINVTDGGTSPMTSAGAATYTASLGGGGTPTLVQSFGLTNNNGSGTSPGFHRAGVPFAKGDVPAGTALQVKLGSTVISAQFDERTTWKDGSLKFAVMHLRDTTFTASEARTYDVWTVPSTGFNNTGVKTLSDITGAHNFKVAFTSVQQTSTNDGSNGDLATVGSGSFTAAFNTHSAVSTRVEKNHSGGVVEGWYIWGMANDNTGGAADAHLKTYWHVDVWKNSDGSIYGYEVGAVPSQDWWSIAGKMRRNYNAALMDGATTIQSFASVVHPYHSQWLTCHTTGLNRGKRFWVGGAEPTLQYTIDKNYWRRTTLIPPYDPTYMPTAYPAIASGTDPYVPGSSQNHRLEFNVAGGYQGRGVITNTDAVAFMRQTASDTACARVSALVGLHVPFHRRSNRTRVRPGDGGVSDTASTIVSLILDVGNTVGTGTDTLFPLPSYDFTAAGLPIPVEAYSFYALPGNDDGYVQPGGYMWPWALSQPYGSHMPNYSYYMYLVEGERYVLESILDLGMNTTQASGATWNESWMVNIPAAGGTPGWVNSKNWNAARPSGEYNSIVWGPFKAWPYLGEERDFNPAILGGAIGLVPDAHVAHGFFKRWQQSLDVGMSAMLYAMPPDILASGLPPYLFSEGETNLSPWESGVTGLSHLHAAAITESASQLAFGNHYAKQAIGIVANYPGFLHDYGQPYRLVLKPKTEYWNFTTSQYFPAGQGVRGAIHLNQVDFVAGQASQRFQYGNDMSVGAMLYWHSQHFDGDLANAPASPPPGITPGAPMYVKAKTTIGGPTNDAYLTLSTSPGGADFVFTGYATPSVDNAGDEWWFKGPSWAWGGSDCVAGQAGGGDTYAAILTAVIVHAKALGNSAATQALVDRCNTLLDSNWSIYVAWKYT